MASSVAEVKNEWICMPTTPYAFRACTGTAVHLCFRLQDE
jgi:hypothetical protein